MASPITVGTTAIVAVNHNIRRATVRFQNSGTTTLYFKRRYAPSVSDYEFMLAPGTTAELNEAHTSTNSVDRFMVVSSASNGVLAIYETIFV